MNADETRPQLVLDPIGIIHTTKKVKFDARHQPENLKNEKNVIELYEGRKFESALQDLNGFDRIWIVWWFHLNTRWRPRVLPPRGSAKRRGVFATRSPHRPNPIGISSVPLLGIEGRFLHIGNCDLVDGTPILDIKPYISSVDSFPDAKLGWIAEVEAQLLQPAVYTVKFSPAASEQIEWLKTEWDVDFTERAVSILERDPTPHRTRRIRKYGENQFQMGCGAWRIYFSRSDKQVLINNIGPGYPERLLYSEGHWRIADRDAQISFLNTFSIK